MSISAGKRVFLYSTWDDTVYWNCGSFCRREDNVQMRSPEFGHAAVAFFQL